MDQAAVLIIGAGLFGLTVARTYTEVHPEADVVLLESAATIGGTWAKHRLYPGLKTNNILGTYESPDFPMESDQFGVAPWNHMPGATIHNYLRAYAEKYKVAHRIRFNSKVTLVERDGGSGGWIVTVDNDGHVYQIHAAKLVLATGVTGNPNLPQIPGAETFQAPLFHAKDFLEHEDLLTPGKKVVVYGGAKSAWDAVYAYVTAGVQVNWVMRESGRGPCWMVFPFVTPFRVWIEKLVFTRLFTWFSPCLWAYADGFDAVRDFLHRTVFGRWAVDFFWNALGSDVLRTNAYNDHPETAKLAPWSDSFWAGTSLSMLNYPTDFFKYIRDGTVQVHHADIVQLSPGTVHLSSGLTLETDALHCSTGWKHIPPVPFNPPQLAAELGLPVLGGRAPTELTKKADEEVLALFPKLREQPNVTPKRKKAVESRRVIDGPRESSYRLYRFMIPPANIFERNFAVAGALLSLGQPVSAQIQAIWLTAYLDGHLRLDQSTSDYEYSTEKYIRFSKFRTPAGCGDKHGDLIFETLPYWDELLRDLGLPFKRKGSFFAETLQPYEPSDYQGLVQELIRLEKSPAVANGANQPLSEKLD